MKRSECKNVDLTPFAVYPSDFYVNRFLNDSVPDVGGKLVQEDRFEYLQSPFRRLAEFGRIHRQSNGQSMK